MGGRIATTAALLALSSACSSLHAAQPCPTQRSTVEGVTIVERIDALDLLLVVDDSGSMREAQSQWLAQLGEITAVLTDPPCSSLSGRTRELHTCDRNDPDDVRAYDPIRSLRVGVISTDLGAAGFDVPGCDHSASGDDGRLNPIRYGAAMREHLPWAPRRPTASAAPAGFRPSACAEDTAAFPSFITFCSDLSHPDCGASEATARASTQDPRELATWFACNAGLYVNGCGLEAPLEAAWRALVEHGAREPAGSGAPNAGFLRDDAALAIVVLTDEEDGSARDCDRDHGFSAQTGRPCEDARDVYDVRSSRWASESNLDHRFYLYAPGSAQDPTWNLDRYFNTAPSDAPNRWQRDLLSLKPGHPERVSFIAIVGAPRGVSSEAARIDWDALLGAPSAMGAHDFNGRDRSTAREDRDDPSGPTSMRGGALDPSCPHVTPACRREGTTFDPARPCADAQSMALPSRRILEVARRFDEHPACGGQACRNGAVLSICDGDYRSALRQLARRFETRVSIGCLPRPLATSVDARGRRTADCLVRLVLPPQKTQCEPARGLRVPERAEDQRAVVDGEARTVCDVAQVSTHPETAEPVPGAVGWYYRHRATIRDPVCAATIEFTSHATPMSGSTVRYACMQAVEPTPGCEAITARESATRSWP
jgi:hypothetical protein